MAIKFFAARLRRVSEVDRGGAGDEARGGELGDAGRVHVRQALHEFAERGVALLLNARGRVTGAGFFNNTGLAFDVEWRYNYSVGWTYKNWGARVAADVVGKYFNDNWTTAGWGENVYTIVSPSVTYRGFRRTTLTLGVTNVFDNRPNPMGHRALGFDDRVYGAGALGISGLLRVRREF